MGNLQTNNGKAQIDALASQVCNVDFDPGDGVALGGDPHDVVSQASALVGVAAKQIAFAAAGPHETAGMNLTGMGVQSATIRADVSGGEPPERPDGAPQAVTDRTSISDKGSLLVYPKVELRWDATGTQLRQDTFINLLNDFPGDVAVQTYFVNGDAGVP